MLQRIVEKSKLLVITALVLVIIYLLSSIFMIYKYKSINQYFTDYLSMSLQTNNNVDIALLPTPHFILHNVNILYKDTDFINTQKIKIYIPIKTLIFGKPSISALGIANANIDYEVLRRYLTHNKSLHDVDIDLSNTTLSNNDLGNIKLNGKLVIGSDNIATNVDFVLNNKEYRLVINNDQKESNIRLSKGDSEIVINGKWQSNQQLKGNVVANFQVHDLPFIKNEYFHNENIKFTADFGIQNSLLNLEKIKFDSDFIDGEKMDLGIGFADNKNLFIEFAVDSLNLDKLIKTSSLNFNKNVYNALHVLLKSFNRLNDSSSSYFDIKLNNLQFGNEIIKDIILYANPSSPTGNQFAATFPGASKLSIQGNFSNNETRQKFAGQFLLMTQNKNGFMKWLNINNEDHNNIGIIKSDIIIMPYNIRFNDFKLWFGNLKAKGIVHVISDDKALTNINLDIETDILNADELGWSQKLSDIFFALYEADGDATAHKYNKFVNNYMWLREKKPNIKGELHVNRLLYNNYEFSDVLVDFISYKNNLYLKEIAAKSKYLDFTGNASITLPTFKPLINIDINAQYLDHKLYKVLFGTHYLNEKIDLLPKNGQFNFLSTKHYDASIKIKADKIRLYKDILVNNMIFDSKIKNSSIIFNKIEYEVFGGNANMRGAISFFHNITDYKISYTLNNMKLKNLFYYLTGLKNKIKGKHSMHGSIKSIGNNFNDIIGNMSGSTQFVAKGVTWKGFGLDNIIEVLQPGLDKQYVQQSIDYYSKYGKTYFDSMQGTIAITNGMANLDNFILRNKRIAGNFVAKYNLANKDCGYNSNFKFIPLNEKKPLSINISGNGNLYNLNTNFNNSEVLEYVAKLK